MRTRAPARRVPPDAAELPRASSGRRTRRCAAGTSLWRNCSSWASAQPRNTAHRVHAAGHDQVCVNEGHRAGRLDHLSGPGSAQPLTVTPDMLVGQASQQPGHPGCVVVVRPGSVSVTEQDVARPGASFRRAGSACRPRSPRGRPEDAEVGDHPARPLPRGPSRSRFPAPADAERGGGTGHVDECLRESQLAGTAGPDPLAVDDVRGHPAQGEVSATLPDSRCSGDAGRWTLIGCVGGHCVRHPRISAHGKQGDVTNSSTAPGVRAYVIRGPTQIRPGCRSRSAPAWS
jgi:hypothetical protein